MRGLRTVTYQEHQPPQPPFLLVSAELVETVPLSRLLASRMSLIPTLQVKPLSQRCTIRPWHGSLLHCEMEPSLWPGLATPLRGKRHGTQGKPAMPILAGMFPSYGRGNFGRFFFSPLGLLLQDQPLPVGVVVLKGCLFFLPNPSWLSSPLCVGVVVLEG